MEYLKQVPYNPKLYYHVLSKACSKWRVVPALKVHVSTAVKCPPVG